MLKKPCYRLREERVIFCGLIRWFITSIKRLNLQVPFPNLLYESIRVRIVMFAIVYYVYLLSPFFLGCANVQRPSTS